MEKLIDHESLKVDGAWNFIWMLHVPSRVKTFLWRLCRDCLPL